MMKSFFTVSPSDGSFLVRGDYKNKVREAHAEVVLQKKEAHRLVSDRGRPGANDGDLRPQRSQDVENKNCGPAERRALRDHQSLPCFSIAAAVMRSFSGTNWMITRQRARYRVSSFLATPFTLPLTPLRSFRTLWNSLAFSFCVNRTVAQKIPALKIRVPNQIAALSISPHEGVRRTSTKGWEAFAATPAIQTSPVHWSSTTPAVASKVIPWLP